MLRRRLALLVLALWARRPAHAAAPVPAVILWPRRMGRLHPADGHGLAWTFCASVRPAGMLTFAPCRTPWSIGLVQLRKSRAAGRSSRDEPRKVRIRS